MIKDIRLHGRHSKEVEFFANLAGEKPLSSHFYEIEKDKDQNKISFFLAGNYITLTNDKILFSGTGGIISEYMFGSPLPLNDLTHKEIQNRLLLFGTRQGESGLEFSSNLRGEITYKELFLEGNAISNTFFLIKVNWPYSLRRTQEVVLKILGKLLKRTPYVGEENDDALSESILKELSDPDALLLLIRLKHRTNSQFYKFVQRHYSKKKLWNDEDEKFVMKFADEINVEEYQRRRIVIDILYKSQENRAIVDEYKDILAFASSAPLDSNKIARLNSLRNLAMRHNLPLALFDTLDNLIPKAKDLLYKEKESKSLKEMRSILEGLFLSSARPRDVIGKEELSKLLKIKHEAHINRDNGFEHILLDTGRILDEKAAETEDFEAFELFTEIVTYFDRLDNAMNVINHLAFLEEAEISEDKIRSLLGNKKLLDEIDPKIFNELVIEPIFQNSYSLRFGKKKVELLVNAISKIEKNEMNISQAAFQINAIANAERAHNFMLEKIKEIFSRFYFDLSKQSHISILKKEVYGLVKKNFGEEYRSPEGAFESALEQFISENEYLTSVFPRIIAEHNDTLREQFIREKNIDRSRIEEIEKEYKRGNRIEENAENSISHLNFDEILKFTDN
ncbi:MAG: TIGR04442 family protein [Thermoanaerobaculaceae bacterium]|nr:TIGR04442 family protein [Thermoanaerobaculaceae bacterium]